MEASNATSTFYLVTVECGHSVYTTHPPALDAKIRCAHCMSDKRVVVVEQVSPGKEDKDGRQ